MNEEIVQALLSKRAVTIYEILAILLLILVLIRQSRRNRQLRERREISNVKMRNVQLEKILKNPDIKKEQSKPPNPFDVQYKHNANNPVPRFQIGIEVCTDISVQKYLFDLNQDLTIGRDPKNVLPLNDTMIARRSCVIFLKDQNVYLKDLGAKNPVCLNRGKKKQKIQKQMVKLQNKDVLTLGKVSLHITLYDN